MVFPIACLHEKPLRIRGLVSPSEDDQTCRSLLSPRHLFLSGGPGSVSAGYKQKYQLWLPLPLPDKKTRLKVELTVSVFMPQTF